MKRSAETKLEGQWQCGKNREDAS